MNYSRRGPLGMPMRVSPLLAYQKHDLGGGGNLRWRTQTHTPRPAKRRTIGLVGWLD